MTLEENVLAYLDGSLGEAESAELLHTLSVSPDKRAVLEEHLRLSGVLKLGRKPFAVPAAAERELAARLPFLADASRIVPFYAKPAVLVTSAAAILAVVGGLWWNASRDVTPVHSNAPIAARQHASGTLAASEQVAANVANTNVAPSNDIAANVPNAFVNSGARRDGARATTSNTGSSESVSHELTHTREVNNDIASAAHRSVEEAAVADHSTATMQSNSSDESVPTISAAAVTAAVIRIPAVAAPRTLHEIAFGVPDRLRPLSIGASAMASGYYFPSLDGSAQSSSGMDPQFTISYDITQWFAFGLEAGYTQFGKVTNHYELAPAFDGTEYSQLSYKTGVDGTSTGYARAVLHFTVDPTSDYPVHFGAAGGYAFEGTSAPCAAVSAGISRTLRDDLSLDLDMVLSGLWSTQVDQAGPNVAGVTGIKYNSAQSQAPFTSAFGLRAGIRYRP
jgi:hypothetical protein